jgi:crotonobetainyl-CoA:carnitine CoA-transferase CaiB-like acyl-CoA transferase
MKFSRTPASIRTRPPLHGEHTSEVLREIGIDEAEEAVLRQEGAL